MNSNTVMIQNGETDFTKPIGTGPFKFKTFKPGDAQPVRRRTRTTGRTGKPYVDEWEDISIDDNTARLNALLSGEIDTMSQLDYAAGEGAPTTGEITVVIAAEPGPCYASTWASTPRRSTTRRCARRCG